jgi:hypothetical protein
LALIVDKINELMVQFGKESYYDNPIFHISVAFLADSKDELKLLPKA